ncbi:MAG: DoxX family protein [Nevskiaceae bacterium]
MNKLYDVSDLLGRILLSLIFVVAGYTKIGGYAGTQAYMESMGVPGMLLPLVIVTELGGGLLVVLGLWTRIAAFGLAGFSVLAGLLFHFKPDDQMQMMVMMKDIAMGGGFLFIAAHGAGAFSLDAWRARKAVAS